MAAENALILAVTWLLLVTAREITDNAISETVPDKPTEQLVCPPSSVNPPLFSLPCKTHVHCEILNQLCCSMDGKKRCQKGVPKPSPKQKHAPFLNVIPRECPDNPLVEPWGVQNCTEDSECWPRICCPEGSTSYCRTSPPTFKLAPRLFPLKNAVAYLQCTTPPPPIFDLFPKSYAHLWTVSPICVARRKIRKFVDLPRDLCSLSLQRWPR